MSSTALSLPGSDVARESSEAIWKQPLELIDDLDQPSRFLNCPRHPYRLGGAVCTIDTPLELKPEVPRASVWSLN